MDEMAHNIFQQDDADIVFVLIQQDEPLQRCGNRHNRNPGRVLLLQVDENMDQFVVQVREGAVCIDP